MTQITRPWHGPALLASGVMLATAMVLAGCGWSRRHGDRSGSEQQHTGRLDHGDRHLLPDARGPVVPRSRL